MSSEHIIHPSEIEKQLTQIWDSLQGTGKMRACLFNLIIYTKKNPRMDYLYKISQKLIEKFPSRIIFITIDEEAKDPVLKTSVSVISAGSNDSGIACDLINIILSKHNEERARFLLLPHILPDLPIYLVWSDDPSKNNPLTMQLEKLATRVIFDSESTDSLTDFADSLIYHKEELASDIADLNWARIEGWRHLLIDTFKSLDKLDHIKNVKELKIHYNSKETEFFCHTKIQAIYLQGWIANQLNWKYEKVSADNDQLHFVYKNQSQTIDIYLIPEKNEDLAPGRVVGLEMTNSQDTYTFFRSKNHAHIIDVKYSTPSLCELPSQFIFDRYESGQSLITEIFHQGTSSHYLSLIKTLKNLPKKVICA